MESLPHDPCRSAVADRARHANYQPGIARLGRAPQALDQRRERAPDASGQLHHPEQDHRQKNGELEPEPATLVHIVARPLVKWPGRRLEQPIDALDNRLVVARTRVVAGTQQLVTAHRSDHRGVWPVLRHIVLRAGP